MLTRWSWMTAALAVLALTSPAVRADDKGKSLAQIKLSGSLAEGPLSDDPFLGGVSETFKTKLDRIKKAAKDDTVAGLLLEIDGVALGWAQLDELSQVLASFRKSGKKAFAYFESADTKDYLLGLACDEVCMPE